MKVQLFTTVLVGLLVTSLAQLKKYNFNCNRNGAVSSFCKNTGSYCDMLTGKCKCGAGFTGVECDQPVPSIDCDDSTSLKCTPNGVCAKNKASVDTCFCNEGYYYNSAEKTCLSMVGTSECTKTDMTMVFRYYGEDVFPGSATILGATATGCSLQPSTSVPKALELYLPFTGSACGDALIDSTDSDVFYYEVLVLYDAGIKSELDQVLVFSCNTSDGDGNTGVTTSPIDIKKCTERLGTKQGETPSTRASNAEVGLTVEIVDSSGNDFTGPQKVATPAILRFSKDFGASPDFRNFHILSVIATAAGDSAPTLIVVKDGCANEDARSYITGFKRVDSTDEAMVDLDFNMLMFTGYPDLLIQTDLILCTTDDCSDVTGKPEDCESVGGAIIGTDAINEAGTVSFRRKRQATNPDDHCRAKWNVSIQVIEDKTTTRFPPIEIPTDNASSVHSLVCLVSLTLWAAMLIVNML